MLYRSQLEFNKQNWTSFPRRREMQSIHWDNWKTLWTK